MLNGRFDIPEASIADFCRKWGIAELSLFGSALRDDFRQDSDVDFLVTFHPDSRHDLWDRYYMLEELKCLFGRPVDMVNRDALAQSANWIRKKAILEEAVTVFDAG